MRYSFTSTKPIGNSNLPDLLLFFTLNVYAAAHTYRQIDWMTVTYGWMTNVISMEIHLPAPGWFCFTFIGIVCTPREPFRWMCLPTLRSLAWFILFRSLHIFCVCVLCFSIFFSFRFHNVCKRAWERTQKIQFFSRSNWSSFVPSQRPHFFVGTVFCLLFWFSFSGQERERKREGNRILLIRMQSNVYGKSKAKQSNR